MTVMLERRLPGHGARAGSTATRYQVHLTVVTHALVQLFLGKVLFLQY